MLLSLDGITTVGMKLIISDSPIQVQGNSAATAALDGNG